MGLFGAAGRAPDVRCVITKQEVMPDTELFESVCEDRDAVHYVGDLEGKRKAAGQK